MIKRELPPLAALRGFEAAARHLSFSLAAEELFLTQGAISRQVRQVELFLKTDLFRRYTRRVELTDAGRELARVVADLLDRLDEVSSRIRRRNAVKTVTVSLLPTIAATWLMPRLHKLAEGHPDIDIRIHTSIETINFGQHGPDLAIRVGKMPGRQYDRIQPRIELSPVHHWQGIHVDELFPDRLTPVCSPALIGGRHHISAEEIALYPLIHTTTRRYAWPDWLRAHGVQPPSPDAASYEFGHFFMALNAAKRGIGIALLPDILLTHEVFGSNLVIPTPADIKSAGDYLLLIPEDDLNRTTISAFRNWIIDEARLTVSAMEATIAPNTS